MIKIKIEPEKCTGCRYCEVVCSLQHYDSVSSKNARIHVFSDDTNQMYFPITAGPYTDAQCTCKRVVTVRGKEVDACVLCPASCPARPVFMEPGTEIPLKCDLCGEPPDPLCVKYCTSGALSIMEV